MNCEEWRWVVGWEGYYRVSNAGNVCSVDRTIHRRRHGATFVKGRPIVKSVDRAGYFRVTLSRNGKMRSVPVHRLVAAAFNGKCPDGLQVRHLDGNPKNNVPSNLRYGTPAENKADSVLHGTSSRQESSAAKLTPDAAQYIVDAYIPGDPICGQSGLAEQFGVSRGAIQQVLRGQTWKNKGEKVNDE